MAIKFIQAKKQESSFHQTSLPAGHREKYISPNRLDPKYTENELKFLVPYETLRDKVNLQALDTCVIEQRYFPKERINSVWQFIIKNSEENLSALSNVKLNQARMRRTLEIHKIDDLEILGSESLELTVKGPKGDLWRNRRFECSLPISESIYKQIMPLANAGYISKYRHPFYARTHKGEAVKVEIDFIKEAGIGENFRVYDAPNHEFLRFATVDCEVSANKAIKELVEGRHNVEFLKRDAKLVSSDRVLSQLLSNRRIAAQGVDIPMLKAALTGDTLSV